MAVVMYHPELGVYLGSCMGMGFWSKLDPVSQEHACTFASADQAHEHMSSWECGAVEGVSFVEVETSADGYASIAACAKAGLPPWITEASVPANTLPA